MASKVKKYGKYWTGDKINRHKRSECQKRMASLCNCLVYDDGVAFFVCCGWYCNTCGGRIKGAPEQRKVRDA